MRRRLVIQAAAVTSLVVISFTVPLMILVRRQATERGQVEAERQAQTAAGLVALAIAGLESVSANSLAAALGNLPAGVGVIAPDGTTLGDIPPQGDVLATVGLGRPAAGFVNDTWQVGIPVATRHGLVAVIASVPGSELGRGVATAWLTFIGLGLLIVVAAVALALRLARELVRPVDELADVAHRLGSGDLSARASEGGPPELSAVGHALNQLSGRLGAMIRAERESLADLSHQLRTPLAALKLQTGPLPEGKQSMAEAVERMEEAVDSLIRKVRMESTIEPFTDLRVVLVKRTTFWRVIAEEQQRELIVHDSHQPLKVSVSEETIGSLLDTLIENVLNHTPAGVSFSVTWRSEGGDALVRVEDAGPGFPPGLDPTERGFSGGGSTGLGLDIARRTAEAPGGRLRWGRSPLGGALVDVILPLTRDGSG